MNEQHNPWVKGYVLGKHQKCFGWPKEADLEEWLEGFKTGTAEIGEFHLWPQLLQEHTAGQVVPAYMLTIDPAQFEDDPDDPTPFT